MTQHIEPAAWMWTDSTGCVHMAGDRPDIYTAAATVAQLPEPLYDAAALAAAEERGRMEERERIREWLREQRKDVPAHGWEFANAVTKEPTP